MKEFEILELAKEIVEKMDKKNYARIIEGIQSSIKSIDSHLCRILDELTEIRREITHEKWETLSPICWYENIPTGITNLEDAGREKKIWLENIYLKGGFIWFSAGCEDHVSVVITLDGDSIFPHTFSPDEWIAGDDMIVPFKFPEGIELPRDSEISYKRKNTDTVSTHPIFILLEICRKREIR